MPDEQGMAHPWAAEPADLTHEVRSALTDVLGLAGMLLDTPLTDRQREYAELIRQSGEALLERVGPVPGRVGAGGHAPLVVAVVDDSPLVRRVAVSRLSADGHTVVEAGDGVEALEVARRVHPDLMVLDRFMPRMDGFEVCMRLREQPETAAMGILILTDLGGEEALDEALRRGADDLIPKPFSPSELSLRLRSLARRRRAA